MSLMNLATVFGPSLLRPPVAGLGPGSVPVDISQEVVVQVSLVLYRNGCVHQVTTRSDHFRVLFVFQVQVVFWFLQCCDLPEARTSLQPDSDQDDESTYL